MIQVLGKDALLQIKKDGVYLNYACCLSFEFTPSIETIEVSTVGDGDWQKLRGRKKSFTLTFSGIIVLDEPTLPAYFDLLAMAFNYEELQFRLLYQDESSNIKVIEGAGIIVDAPISGPTTGNATHNITVNGSGPVSVRDTLDTCDITILSHIIGVGPGGQTLFIVTPSATPLRYDYTVNGGGALTSFSNSIDLGVLAAGSYIIAVTPICTNGLEGTTYTRTITV